MIQKIYEQLKTPKSIEEIHSRLLGLGMDWNIAQVKLFLYMDKNINERSGMWLIEQDDISSIVCNLLDKIFNDKPKMPLSMILNQLPANITIGKSELLKIVEESTSYYLHPNGVIICKKN